ncbi:MAG: SDR family NAD(P)-dependent oxidoreductase [Bacteroidetes bacterium]|nr:SDR family NAD(P)-dependent oxidoreductase [Bacteroidota bacterium]
MFQLNNKIALVTGGGSGIGKDVCKVLAKQGAHVIVVDLNADSAKGTVDEITANGNNAEALTLDVTNQGAVTSAFEKLKSLDILVNCAGISHIGSATSTNETDFEKVFQVNVKGVYNCLQAGVNVMKKSGGGSIVNISSIAAKVGLSDRFAYSMSKGAVHAMTMSVAKDYIKDNIRCNSVSPGRVHTPFVDGFLKKNYPGQEAEMFEKLSKTQPIGRMGLPIEVAHQVLYLCSEEASFITGSDFSIDGGFITLNS